MDISLTVGPKIERNRSNKSIVILKAQTKFLTDLSSMLDFIWEEIR